MTMLFKVFLWLPLRAFINQLTRVFFLYVGVIYVTFTKASEAALAIEKTNGKNVLNSHSLKVITK